MDLNFTVSETFKEKLEDEGADYDPFGNRIFDLDDDGNPVSKPSDKIKKNKVKNSDPWGDTNTKNSNSYDSRNSAGAHNSFDNDDMSDKKSLRKIDPNASYDTISTEKYSAMQPLSDERFDIEDTLFNRIQLKQKPSDIFGEPPPKANYMHNPVDVPKKPKKVKKSKKLKKTKTPKTPILPKRKSENYISKLQQHNDYLYCLHEEQNIKNTIMVLAGIAVGILLMFLIKLFIDDMTDSPVQMVGGSVKNMYTNTINSVTDTINSITNSITNNILNGISAVKFYQGDPISIPTNNPMLEKSIADDRWSLNGFSSNFNETPEILKKNSISPNITIPGEYKAIAGAI